MEGCINDVGAESIVYPWTQSADLHNSTLANCGRRFYDELEKAHRYFPSAVIVVVGYFRIVSENSSAFGLTGTRRLASHAIREHEAQARLGATHQPPPETR